MGLLQPHERHGRGARPARLKTARARRARPRAVVVHGLDHARAALSAAASLGVPVTVLSGRGAAGYAGPGWFLDVVRLAGVDHPGAKVTAVLDCADRPGRALGALRCGAKALRLDGNPRARKRVAAIAAAMGARLDDAAYETLDLAGRADPLAAVTAFLSGAASFETPAARAPQEEAHTSSPHPEEGQGPVSKDGKHRRRAARRAKPE